MYTQATRGFGIWRENHPTNRRQAGTPTYPLLVALAISVLVAWLTLFMEVKIRSDYLTFESSSIKLPLLKADSQQLQEGRAAALILAAFPDRDNKESNGIQLVFSTGESYRLPADKERLFQWLQKKAEAIQFQSMVMMQIFPEMSRIQIWPEAGLGYSEIKQVVDVFSDFGFDDFDIAVQPI